MPFQLSLFHLHVHLPIIFNLLSTIMMDAVQAMHVHSVMHDTIISTGMKKGLGIVMLV